MRINKQITIGAAPINVLTGLTTAPGSSYPETKASDLFIQMRKGGSKVGYAMTGVPKDIVGDPTNADHLTMELAAATADNPGGAYSYHALDLKGIDIRGVWVHGDNAGDKVIVSYETLGA